MSLQPDLRQRVVAASLVCMTVMAIGAPATAAPSSTTVTVTGGSVEKVVFSVRDGFSEFGSHRALDGDADLSVDATTFMDEGSLAGTHVCYALSGEITVSSNVAYDLLVSDVSVTPGLRFMADPPASYAACASGEPVSDTMFAAADLPGRWAARQPRTPSRVHEFTLGLVVGSGHDPLAVLAGSSFTVFAQAAS